MANVQLTLNRPDIDRLAAFIRTNNCKTVFVAKDHGAYFGASVGEGNNCIFYFAGCDPKKDRDFYDTARAKFGGDDFGERFDADCVLEAADNARCTTLRVVVTPKEIMIQTDGRGGSQMTTEAKTVFAEVKKLAAANAGQSARALLEPMGFAPHSTGGNCMSLARFFGDGAHIIVTDDDCIPDTFNADVTIALFDREGEYFEMTDLQQGITTAWYIEEPMYPDLYALVAGPDGGMPTDPEHQMLTFTLYQRGAADPLEVVQVEGRRGMYDWYEQNVGPADADGDQPPPIMEVVKDAASYMLAKHHGDGVASPSEQMSTVSIADLVAFCREAGWQPHGVLERSAGQPETFTLSSSRGRGWTIRFINAAPDGSDGLADHVNDMEAVTLEVKGVPFGMTWGEATELVNAMARILGIGMFG